MKKQWVGTVVLAVSLGGQMCGDRDAVANPVTAEPVRRLALDGEYNCPGNRLPLAPLYWHSVTEQLQWQVTDQQIGWSAAEVPMQMAELNDKAKPAEPVRQQSWHSQPHDLLFWQQPDGDLHAVRVTAGRLEFLWQVSMSANPTWLPAPLTMLSTPLAGQVSAKLPASQIQSKSERLLVSGEVGQAVQIVDPWDGRTEQIDTPDSAGAAIANPVAFDTDMNGQIDRIYFINAQQQIWRLDWQQADHWQPSLIARLDRSVGIADAALQGWAARWPVLQNAEQSGLQVSARESLLTKGAVPATPGVETPHQSASVNTKHGDLLLMLTRQAAGYGLLLLKVASEPGPVIDIGATRATAQTNTEFSIAHQRLTEETSAAALIATDTYWFLHIRQRPVRLPVVLGSVVYLPVSTATTCPFPPDYQQVVALNLFSGQAVYDQLQLRFRQPQNSGLRLHAESSGFSLGTSSETLLSQIKLVDPQCQFCVRTMTADMLSQRRWLAGYLAEEAF